MKRRAPIVECPECRSRRMYRDSVRAELICMDCGYVILERNIDREQEWRAYNEEQREARERTGPPPTPTLHDYGRATTIGKETSDLTPEQRARVRSLKRTFRRTFFRSGKEASLAFALSEINKMSSHLSLPQTVTETAATVYRRFISSRCARGRALENIAAAAVIVACKLHKIPRTITEIVSVTATKDRKEIVKCYKMMLMSESKQIATALGPEEFVSRAVTELKLSGAVQTIALEVLRSKRLRTAMRGITPHAVAAAVVYLASIVAGEYATQRDVANVFGISDATVRNTYKRIVEVLGKKVVI